MTYDGRTRVVVMAEPRPGAVDIVLRDIPALGEQEALVEIRRSGICGTDLQLIAWSPWAAARYRPPFALGHELCGAVVEAGPGAAVAVGERVSAETHWGCGACRQCRMGRAHTCERLRTFSRLDQGAWADYAVIPSALLRRAPAAIDDDVVAVMEPAGIALRAVQEAGARGRTLFVSGCGPIGLMAVAAAKSLGISHVVAADPVAARRELALKVGAERVLDPCVTEVGREMAALADGSRPAAAVETSGVAAALQTALQAVDTGGRVVCAGLPSEPIPIDVTAEIVLREVSLHGVYGRLIDRTWVDLEAALVADLDLRPILTDTFGLEQVHAALARAQSGLAGKVLLQP